MHSQETAGSTRAGLADSVAVVTGAGQGIGEAVAKKYAAAGSRVAVVDFNADSAARVVAEIVAEGGHALPIVCDVADDQQVTAAAEKVTASLGTIDILVNNAGITRPAMLWKMTTEQWADVFAVHVHGSFHWMQATVPGMRSQGRGTIIFTTSAAGIAGTIGQMNYAAAKAAQLGMVRSAAKELAGAGITVNAVAPSAATPMTEAIRTDERFKDKYLSETPLNRWAEPEEIAGTYVFLASADARYMTGQVLSVDGGRIMVR